MLSRRSFLKGIAGAVGAAIILPPTVEQVAAEVERRYWALDSTMTNPRPDLNALIERVDWSRPRDALTIREAWSDMGFRVGDMVQIVDYQDLAMPVPRQARDLYRIERMDWGDVSLCEIPAPPPLAESVSRVERYFDSAKFRELLA